MNGTKTIFVFLCLTTVCKVFVLAEESSRIREDRSGQIREVEIFRGVNLIATNEEVSLNVRLLDLFEEDEATGKSIGREKGSKKIPVKKIGMMMMMVPFAMQMFSLPAALATIKMSLLRSILVGKLALIIMLINTLRNSRNSEEIVVHQPYRHNHHYHNYGLLDEEKESWWRK